MCPDVLAPSLLPAAGVLPRQVCDAAPPAPTAGSAAADGVAEAAARLPGGWRWRFDSDVSGP